MIPFGGFLNNNSLANVLIFDALVRKFRITIYTDIDPEINVHLDSGTSIKFKQCSGILYYYDTTNIENNTTNNQVIGYTFIIIVESKNSYFHIREIKGSDSAIILQQLVGCPSIQALKEAVGNNQIRN